MNKENKPFDKTLPIEKPIHNDLPFMYGLEDGLKKASCFILR